VTKFIVFVTTAVEEAVTTLTTHGFGRWPKSKPCGVTLGVISAAAIEKLTRLRVLIGFVLPESASGLIVAECRFAAGAPVAEPARPLLGTFRRLSRGFMIIIG
jgi:hypothetical protein